MVQLEGYQSKGKYHLVLSILVGYSASAQTLFSSDICRRKFQAPLPSSLSGIPDPYSQNPDMTLSIKTSSLTPSLSFLWHSLTPASYCRSVQHLPIPLGTGSVALAGYTALFCDHQGTGGHQGTRLSTFVI